MTENSTLRGVTAHIDAINALASGPYGKESVVVQKLAQELTAGSDRPVDIINDWVRGHVVYVNSPIAEADVSPEQMASDILKNGRCFADASDIALFVAGLSLAVNLEVRYVAVGFNGRNVTHVFADAKTPGDVWGDPLAGKTFTDRVTKVIVFSSEERRP